MRETDAPVWLSTAIADALTEWEAGLDAWFAEERWPLRRLYGRQKISRYVRKAVFQRDGGRCMSCGDQLTLETAHLDHIMPWPAFGADDSANLRILCIDCNVERSNFRGPLDMWAVRRPPIAFCCTNCLSIDRDDLEADDIEIWEPASNDLVLAFCAHCGLVSRTWPGEIW
jgi:hypothetical protein